jgi:hypothetical protein
LPHRNVIAEWQDYTCGYSHNDKASTKSRIKRPPVGEGRL